MKPHFKALATGTIALAACAITAFAQPIASDNAGNYGGGWTDGSTGGTGFGSWSITNNNDGTTIFAGSFIGDSTAGAGDLNTSGVSFALYANPGTPTSAFINADRNFSTALAVGNTFSFQLGVNFDNGNKGFNLYSGGVGATQLMNFNIGGGASVNPGTGLTLNAGSGATYDYGGPAVLDVSIAYTDASTLTYLISRSSTQGNQGTLFSGSVTGTFSAPDGFRFYNSGTDNGDAANNFYINSLTVVPEPSTYALLGLGAASILWRIRRRKVS